MSGSGDMRVSLHCGSHLVKARSVGVAPLDYRRDKEGLRRPGDDQKRPAGANRQTVAVLPLELLAIPHAGRRIGLDRSDDLDLILAREAAKILQRFS